MPSDSNFRFLLNLSLNNRNWKEECCICLSNKIMGTTCTCGHREIVCFRPCGHSMCVNPCYISWMKNKKITLNPTIYNFDNIEYILNDEVDVNNNPDNLICPLCRTNIDSTFRAETAYMSKTDKQDLNII